MTPSSRVYISPPRACATTEAIAARDAGAFVPGTGGGRREYALPEKADEALREFFRPEAAAMPEAPFLARLPGGRVYGSGNVLSADGTLIARDVSPDFGKPFAEHWLLSFPKMTAPRPLPGMTAVVATTLGEGYAHWLLEELPRWLSFDFSGCDAVIAHGETDFARQAIQWLGCRGKIIEPVRFSHWACDELLVPSLVASPGYASPEMIRLVDGFVGPQRIPAAAFGERLYLSRAKSRRRRVRNEDELWRQLESRGFRRLFLEDLDWPTQIAAFRAARIMVAPHGAGLANLIFCQGGARVVELFNPAYVDGGYWRLAALKGLDYRPLVGPGERPLRRSLPANRDDLEVEVAQVIAAVSAG